MDHCGLAVQMVQLVQLVKHPIGVLHSFSIKNIFYYKMGKAFLFSCDDI